MAKNQHLTLSERNIIEQGLNNHSSRKAIADLIGKDKSTVCKEIKSHVHLVPFSRSGVSKKGTYDCTLISECGFNAFCTHACDKRIPVPCKQKDSPSGVCNGCSQKSTCKLTKKIYTAEDAQAEYKQGLVEMREGWNLSYNDAKQLADIIGPLLKKGQSIAVILNTHDEISYSEKTIYNYIDQGALSQFGITNMDLRRKTSRRITKRKSRQYKPRKDRKYLKGRTYKDFLDYMAQHPEASVVEMDTVYNDILKGPFIQTFQFVDFHFMIGIYHDFKTSEEMYNGLKQLHDAIGETEFHKIVQVVLTDRGSEFTWAEQMEALGCKVFYCDSMCSWQKPHVENNHTLFRFVCPKETDLRALGLTDQNKVDLVFSHVNSYSRESLHGRSPYETFEFYYPDSSILDDLNIKKIDSDDVVLEPKLLK